MNPFTGIVKKEQRNPFLGIIKPKESKFQFPLETVALMGEPPPFQIDEYIEKRNQERTIDSTATDREGLAISLWPVVRSWLAQGYNASSALNRGVSEFAENIDMIFEYLSGQMQAKKKGIKLPSGIAGLVTGEDYTVLMNKVADYYDRDSERWKKRAKEVGINFIDELISEAIGGAPTGVAQFMLGVPYAGLLGAVKAERAEENPFIGAFLEATERKLLGEIFRAIGPLKQYLRAPIMGGVFGVQAAAEGVEPKKIAKGIGTGALYSLSSPGGAMGLNEVRKNLRKQIPKPELLIPEKDILKVEPKVNEIIESKPRMVEPEAKVLKYRPAYKLDDKLYIGESADVAHFQLEQKLPEGWWNKKLESGWINEKGDWIPIEKGFGLRGLIKEELKPEAKVEVPTLLEEFPKREGEPEIRERKYWRTVEEAERTAEGAKFVMQEIQKEEPQINIVEPNRSSLEKAYGVLEEKGFENTVKYTYESKELKPVEKGALFNVLMEQAQKTGDWAKFTEIMDSYSLYLVDLGRGVQIASVWTKSTPVGFIKWAEKQLDSVNKKYGWFDTILGRKKATLTEQDKIFMVQELNRIQKMPEGIEKSNEMLKLIDYVAIKVPPAINEFIDTYRYQNMLCGPQTQERNIGFNMESTFLPDLMKLESKE